MRGRSRQVLARALATALAVAGDPVLLRPLVARPTFGCRFTDGAHANFSAPACPVVGG
jgi:hypothetical protein